MRFSFSPGAAIPKFSENPRFPDGVTITARLCFILSVQPRSKQRLVSAAPELSPNLGDGLRHQAAAVWDCEDAGLATTSIPSVNLTP